MSTVEATSGRAGDAAVIEDLAPGLERLFSFVPEATSS